MKKISAVLSIVLVLSMLLCLTGCSSDADKLVGTWECELDLSEQLNDELASDPEVAEFVEIKDFTMVIIMEFEDDGTYSMSVDEDALGETFESLKVDVAEGMAAYLENMALEEMGVEMTADEIMELAGMNMDDLINSVFTEEMLDELVSGMEQEGNFEAKNGKLYTSAGLDYDVDPEVYETYELDGDELTLLEYHGDDDDVMDIYPMEFEKVD